MHRLAFLLNLNLIIHHYFIYVNAFTLVHLSVFKFASIDLTLVRFTLNKGTGSARKLCVLTCLIKVD